MSYQIIIKKEAGKSSSGYTQWEDVYEQTVIDIDLWAVIQAANKVDRAAEIILNAAEAKKIVKGEKKNT